MCAEGAPGLIRGSRRAWALVPRHSMRQKADAWPPIRATRERNCLEFMMFLRETRVRFL